MGAASPENWVNQFDKQPVAPGLEARHDFGQALVTAVKLVVHRLCKRLKLLQLIIEQEVVEYQ